MGGQKFRRVSCTLHNPEHNMDSIDWSTKPELRFIIGQLEAGGKTGAIHWQFYMEFKKAVSPKFIKETVGDDSMHLEKSIGTADDNIRYCNKPETKEGRQFRWGTPGKETQGKRTDLELVRDQVLRGETSARDILINDPMTYHQYGRTIERLQAVRNRNTWRTWMTKGIWLYGPTGVGKSERAFEGYNPDTHYVLNTLDSGWWEGYNGQEVVIIDDFRGNIPYMELLSLVDKKPKEVKQRYIGNVPFLAKTVIVTSSMRPERVYKNLDPEDKFDQIHRRFEIIYMGGQADGSGQGNTRPDHEPLEAVNQSIEI